MMDDISIDWQVAGLTLNIVGVFFIVNSLYFKRPSRAIEEHFSVEKKRPLRAIRDSVLSMVQLVIGFVFVIAGYFLQIGHQLAMTVEERSNFFSDPNVLQIAAILIGSMALVTLVLKVCQIFWTKWTFRKLLIVFYRENPWALEKFPATAKEAGEILGVERKKEDSVAEYLDRLRTFLEIQPAPRSPKSDPTASTRTRVGIAEPMPTAPHPATPPRILS